MNTNEIASRLKHFIVNEIMKSPKEDLHESVPLLELGILDSMGMMHLITFIQKEYQIRIPDQNIVPENFDNLKHIAQLVEKLLSHRGKLAA